MRNRLRAAMAATALACVPLSGCSPEAFKKVMDEAQAQQVDDELLKNPTYGRSFTYLHDHFPSDYASLRTDLTRAEAAGAGKAEISEISFQFATRLVVAHSADFGAARDEPLAQYRSVQIRSFETMQRESVTECANSAAPVDAKSNQPLNTTVADAQEDVLYAMLETMNDGRTAKVRRDPPSRADYKAEVEAMEIYGVTRDDIIAMSKIETFTALPAEHRCKIAVASLKAINSLPPEQADRVTVEHFKANATRAAGPAKPPQHGS
jgi:hypothetical protein